VTTSHDEPVFDPLAIARRRLWSLLIPVAGGVVVGLLLVLFLPREYVASATLAVTTPTVANDLAKGTMQDPSDRTRAISQELLSLPVIEQVSREEGLITGSDADEVVAGVRARTSVSLPVKPIAAGRGEPDVFIVSYTGSTAQEAQRVTNRLLRVFIDRDTASRRTRAKETAGFLGEQLRESQRRMDEIEGKLRKVKELNTGLLPEQALANLQAMSDLRSRSDNNQEAIREERDRLATLEAQVEAARKEASFETRGDDEVKVDDRLTTLETDLAAARRTYTPKHPEVQRLEAALATARIEQSEVRARAAVTKRPPPKSEQALAMLVAERDRVRIRLRDLQLVETRLPREMAIYEARVNQAPIVEQQLAPLEQAYEIEKANHQKLSERYQAAAISESLETRQAGSQFAVLYPAGLPPKPSQPNVPRVFAFSVFAGALLGGALAFTREYLDKTVHDARTLQHEFDQPVLAEIPHLRSKRA
jgi:polysaccharide biosynthesis transport protein